MDRWQYLGVMAACLLVTLPLELVVGASVCRRPRRLARVLAPVVAGFYAWDVWAIDRGHWTFDERYTTGVVLPGAVPLEELVFFVVIPVCALLSFEAVGILADPAGRRRVLARLRRGAPPVDEVGPAEGTAPVEGPGARVARPPSEQPPSEQVVR